MRRSLQRRVMQEGIGADVFLWALAVLILSMGFLSSLGVCCYLLVWA